MWKNLILRTWRASAWRDEREERCDLAEARGARVHREAQMSYEDPEARTLGLSSVLPKNLHAFDPTFSGPRDIDRSFTDRGSFVLFCCFIGSVAAIASNAFMFGPGELEKLPRVFTTANVACGTDVLVWWPREEPLFPTPGDDVLRVCSSFCPQDGSRLCLDSEAVVRETAGTTAFPDAKCATDPLEWQTKTIQRFGRCFTDVESCGEQTGYEKAELDQISAMDITIRALLDMWHSRWLILAVGCVIPVLFSWAVVRWLARPRAAKEEFRIALPQVTLSLLLSVLPALALQVLNQKLKGFFNCFYVDKFLMPAVTYIALAILGSAIVMAIACFLLRRKLKVCSKLAIETARCMKILAGAHAAILLSCMASCSVAVGWFGLGSYVLCWALDLEARDRINANLRTAILILFSIDCLWLAAFVGAVSRLTLSGAVSDWFWQHKPKDTKNAIQLSLRRSLFRHPGTAAKGSLLITSLSVWRSTIALAFVWLRVLISGVRLFKKIMVTIVMQKKVDEVVEIGDGAHDALREKKSKKLRIHVVSRRAYNSVALHGRGLIDSGSMTKRILKGNAYRVGRCYGLMGEVNVIVTFMVMVLCLCLSVLAAGLFDQPSGLGKGSESPIGMIFCVMVTSFTAVQGAFAPFHQASTSLVQCFCEDLDRNDGSPVNPYRAGKRLRELVAGEHPEVFSTGWKDAEPIVVGAAAEEIEEDEGEKTALRKAREFLVKKIGGLPSAALKSVWGKGEGEGEEGASQGKGGKNGV